MEITSLMMKRVLSLLFLYSKAADTVTSAIDASHIRWPEENREKPIPGGIVSFTQKNVFMGLIIRHAFPFVKRRHEGEKNKKSENDHSMMKS